MIVKKSERTPILQENPAGGTGVMERDHLLSLPHCPEKVRLYAHMELAPGAAVGYHEHHGESECYYILEGEGTYNDDGTLCPVSAGDVTFTPSGHGHGLQNSGDKALTFMALIVLDEM